MAIQLPDGKVLRTLPEQVKKNQDDIETLNNKVVVIEEGITKVYKIQGNATVSDLNNLAEITADMNGDVYNMTDAGSLNNADASTTSVQIGDNVVLVWNDGDYFWDRLAGLVDTSNLVTLDTDQTITGVKTFAVSTFYANGANILPENDAQVNIGASTKRINIIYTTAVRNEYGSLPIRANGDVSISTSATGGLRPDVDNRSNLGSSSYTWKDLYLSGSIKFNGSAYITDGGTNGSVIKFYRSNVLAAEMLNGWLTTYTSIRPNSGNTYDLGSSSNQWKDIYLSGNLTDGTNNVAVAEIVKKRFNIANYHAPSTLGNIEKRSFTLSVDLIALLDANKPVFLAEQQGTTGDILLGGRYNLHSGTIEYVAYGTEATGDYITVYQ